MTRMHLLILLAMACNADASTDDNGADSQEDGSDTLDGATDDVELPTDVDIEGYTEASHAKGDGDYSILMGDGDVPRIDIVIDPDNAQVLADDLADLTGVSFLGPGGGGPGGGGPGGGGPGGGGGGGTFPDQDPVYVPATLMMDDKTWPAVGFRYKGNSTLYGAVSSGVAKLPFRLAMDHYEDEVPETEDQRFYGFKDLKFSSGYNDTSLQRDKLASDTFREAGVPAAMGGFVEVYIDQGEGPVYWGLYTVFEDPAGEMLDSWFGDDDGNMYKPDGDAAALETFVEADFEKKTNEEEADFTDVQALITALNADQSDAAAWREDLDAVFDTDGFLRYLAVNNLIANWDAYGRMTHNYYLYNDPQTELLTWVPWDFNESFASENGNRAPINIGMTNIPDGWPLLEFLADDPVYRGIYEDHVDELLTTVFTQEALDARIEANRARIADAASRETAPYTAQTGSFEAATTALSSHVASQRSDALD